MPDTNTPVLRHTDAAAQWATSPERTVVFSVTRPNPDYLDTEGADLPEGYEQREPRELSVDYTMPSKPNAGLALAYLKQARANADLAMSWLIETAIGDEGYDALTDELSGIEDPREAQALLIGIVTRIQTVAMGGLDGQGNAPKA
jgi:hypothetical protein